MAKLCFILIKLSLYGFTWFISKIKLINQITLPSLCDYDQISVAQS